MISKTKLNMKCMLILGVIIYFCCIITQFDQQFKEHVSEQQVLQFSHRMKIVNQVEAAASNEERECLINVCAPAFDDAPVFYNITCGYSGENLGDIQVFFGNIVEGECSENLSETTEPFEFQDNCEASNNDIERVTNNVMKACSGKPRCSSIFDEVEEENVSVEEYIKRENERIQPTSGSTCSSTPKISISAACKPPGFDAIAILPNFITAFVGLGLGCSLTWENFIRVWKAHKLPFLIGIFSQFFFMPLIAYIFAVALNFPQQTGIGIMLMGCMPGGATSNLFTYWSKGDVALSIAMSGASTLASVAMMPFLLWLYVENTYQNGGTVPFDTIFITLCIATLPALFGVVLRNKNEKAASYLEISASAVGIMFLFGILALGIIQNPDLLVVELYPLTWTVCFLYQPLGTFFGYGAASSSTCLGAKWRIDRPDKRAIAMECGVQNYTIAIALVANSFSGCMRNATLMPIYIASLCYIINSAWLVPFFRYLSRYDPPEETEKREKELQEYADRSKNLEKVDVI